MIGEKPRPWPPRVIVAFQSTSSSGVVPLQSVKSGNVEGRSNIVAVSGAPAPVGPWQPAHPAWYSAWPLVSPRAGDWPTGPAADAVAVQSARRTAIANPGRT